MYVFVCVCVCVCVCALGVGWGIFCLFVCCCYLDTFVVFSCLFMPQFSANLVSFKIPCYYTNIELSFFQYLIPSDIIYHYMNKAIMNKNKVKRKKERKKAYTLR